MSAVEQNDLVIVGAGPAGLAATIYATRAMLDFVTLEGGSLGGQVVLTNEIDNYPGVPGTNGFDLSDTMRQHAEDLGAKFVMKGAHRLSYDANSALFSLFDDEDAPMFEAKSVIVASGATPRKAGFEGEDAFYGKGVSYCATCDGMFYRNKDVFVIGGGNSALEEALFLTRFARKVTLIVRKDHVRAQASILKEAEENEKIEFRYLTSITKVSGDQLLKSVSFKNNETGETWEEEFEEGSFGIFVFVGHTPTTDILGDLVDYSERGAVLTNEKMETKTPGLYCAGDVREKYLRQILTAAADGAIAATAASSFLGHPVEG